MKIKAKTVQKKYLYMKLLSVRTNLFNSTLLQGRILRFGKHLGHNNSISRYCHNY